MRKAAEYLGYALMALLMVAAVLTYLAPHFGWRVNAVLSGSMEPSLKVGSLVVSRPVDPETVLIGDVITFRLDQAAVPLVTHRVDGIGHSSPLYFETRGDANKSPDPFTVPARNLVGKIVLHIPYAGYATEFLKTPLGFVLGLLLPALIVIVMYLRDIWRFLNRDKQGSKEVAGR